MSYSHRIWIYGPVGALLLLVLLYSIFWRVQADVLAARLDRANGGEIVPGIVFAFAGEAIGGFPFRLDAVLDGVTLVHQGMDGETAWRTEKLALHAMTFGRGLYLLETQGLQSFELPGEQGESPRVIQVTPAVARASAILRENRLARFDLDLWQPEGKDASLGADATRTFSAARAQVHLLGRPDETVDVAMKIEDARLGAGFHPALGTDLSLVELRGKLSQSGTLTALESGTESVADAADHWREAGGALAVQRLTLDWAGVKTDLSGALTIDAEHRPEGALIGSLDPGAVLSALSGGGLNVAGLGKSKFSLNFKDGDILVGAGSALGGAAR